MWEQAALMHVSLLLDAGTRKARLAPLIDHTRCPLGGIISILKHIPPLHHDIQNLRVRQPCSVTSSEDVTDHVFFMAGGDIHPLADLICSHSLQLKGGLAALLGHLLSQTQHRASSESTALPTPAGSRKMRIGSPPQRRPPCSMRQGAGRAPQGAALQRKISP